MNGNIRKRNDIQADRTTSSHGKRQPHKRLKTNTQIIDSKFERKDRNNHLHKVTEHLKNVSKKNTTRKPSKVPRRVQHQESDGSGNASGSEIDSDEAFGESDEERFEGFAFRGSSTTASKGIKGNSGNPSEDWGFISNDESHTSAINSESGSGKDEELEAINLEDVLQDDRPIDPAPNFHSDSHISDDITPEDINNSEAVSSRVADIEKAYSDISDEEEDSSDSFKAKQLDTLIKSLPSCENEDIKKYHSINSIEMLPPSNFHIPASRKLTVEDLLPAISRTPLEKSLKLLKEDGKAGNGFPGKLEVPLPRRKQNQIDRVAANRKAKETLERWVDTVKQNRRAEHVSFPMQSLDNRSSLNVASVQRDAYWKPTTNLENTVHDILLESGMKNNLAGGEKDIQKFEEIQIQKLPAEEVLARKAKLRKTRDLLFREEIRAKRIKKIKSKAYRRSHRRERKQNAANILDLHGAELNELTAEEKEQLNRQRAEQRMNVKHRESKWSREAKSTGRTIWDQDTRLALSDMADRSAALRKRIEGQPASKKDDLWSDESFEGIEYEATDNTDDEISNKCTEEDKEKKHLLNTLNHLVENEEAGKSKHSLWEVSRKGSKRLRSQNMKEIEKMKREITAEENSANGSDEEAASVGRRFFGAKRNMPAKSYANEHKQEFEEHPRSSDEEVISDHLTGVQSTRQKLEQKKARITSSHKFDNKVDIQASESRSSLKKSKEGNPWLKCSPGKRKVAEVPSTNSVHAENGRAGVDPRRLADTASSTFNVSNIQPSNQEMQKTNTSNSNDAESDQESSNLVTQNDRLIREAFAGDGVLKDFEKEKKTVMFDEEDKTEDLTLPGWGSWVGDGLSKRSIKRNRGKVLQKVEGIEAEKRRDAKLQRVIINEKRIRKNTKYMATSLPHPFETKLQYEKSLRLPVGREWTTGETFLNATKPRILVKPNAIIQPLQAPVV